MTVPHKMDWRMSDYKGVGLPRFHRVRMRVRMCVRMRVRMCVRMRVRMCVRMCCDIRTYVPWTL